MGDLDLWPLLEQLTIKTKKARLKPLRRDDRFAWAQRAFVAEVERQYNAGLPVRIIVLKGRQLGLSTVSEAILFLWCFLHPGAQCLVLSKKDPESEYLFGITKRYWELGPYHDIFTTNYNRQGYIEWAETGSSIITDTAKNEDPGRGRTLMAVHGSEVAFWPAEDKVAGGLMEAIPDDHGSICIFESTANGVGGLFHDEWMKATDPRGAKSVFTPMFFPWYRHDEYEIAETHLRYSDLDEEERDIAQYLLDHRIERRHVLPKLAWRRRKATTYTDPQLFVQEYPLSPDEAFLSTGTNVFPLAKLRECYEPDMGRQGWLYSDGGRLQFQENSNGHTWVFRQPDPRGRRRYVVGVDPTWTVNGDPASIQVLDRASMEQVCVWHGSADPETVGQNALAIARWYGPETILNTEVQGGGRRVLEVWRAANWNWIWMDRRPDRPRKTMASLCWNSTYETKRWMIGTMQGIIHRLGIRIHHAATYYEMCRYIAHEDDTYGPARRSGHDDTVIALGIAIMTAVTEASSLDWQAMAAPAPYRVPGEKLMVRGIGEPVEVPGLRRAPDHLTDELIGVDDFY